MGTANTSRDSSTRRSCMEQLTSPHISGLDTERSGSVVSGQWSPPGTLGTGTTHSAGSCSMTITRSGMHARIIRLASTNRIFGGEDFCRKTW